MISKIIKFCKDNEKDLFIAGIIILVALISFGLGRLSKIEEGRAPITIESMGASAETGVRVAPAAETLFQKQSGKFVASKNGTKYHFPWCPGALRIKEENKVWFSSREEAEAEGLSPAKNCKGL
jgi:hypothetical protein